MTPQQLAEKVLDLYRQGVPGSMDAGAPLELAREVLRLAEQAEAHRRDAIGVREKMMHNAANLDFAIEQREAAEAEVAKLREALTDYANHQSWRCDYRSRYKECCCGLDDLMRSLGLPIVEVHDPEAASGEKTQ